MDHEESLVEAARRADRAVRRTMRDYRRRYIRDEEEITAYLLGSLRTEFSVQIGHLRWTATILRHRRGVAAEEKMWGADMLLHVSLRTATLSYSKGVLVQAKRLEANRHLFNPEYQNLVDQCHKMLAVTPASFVFAYASQGMRCGPATAISGSSSRTPYEECVWTSYRFFLEMFRCPIGDPRITSAAVEALPVPAIMRLAASDPISEEGAGPDEDEHE
jgi:hypothetical protein